MKNLILRNGLKQLGRISPTNPRHRGTIQIKSYFEMNLSELARKFHHFRAVSFERQRQSEKTTDNAGEVIRVGITTFSEAERERVITVPPTAEAQIDNIERGFEEVFKEFGVDGDANLRLAILARLSQRLMEQLEE